MHLSFTDPKTITRSNKMKQSGKILKKDEKKKVKINTSVTLY